jgi:hypothetical protein
MGLNLFGLIQMLTDDNRNLGCKSLQVGIIGSTTESDDKNRWDYRHGPLSKR